MFRLGFTIIGLLLLLNSGVQAITTGIPYTLLDQRYVNTTGDTMTGTLTVESNVTINSTLEVLGKIIVPMGEINYFSTTGTAEAIITQSDGSTNMVVATIPTTLESDVGFDNGGADNGRLRYTGTATRMFHIACTISIAPDAANDTFVLGIAKNGTVIPSSKVLQKITTMGDTQSTALHVMTDMMTNDYLEFYIGNITDADDLVIKSLTLFAMGL